MNPQESLQKKGKYYLVFFANLWSEKRRNSLWFTGSVSLILCVAAGGVSNIMTVRKQLNTRMVNMEARRILSDLKAF